MKKEVLFRVNAGGDAGSGHLMRCLVLARMLKKEYDPYFLVKGDNKIGEMLYKENFNFKLAMHGFEQEIPDIKGLRPNLIVLDMRETPIDFVRTIKEFAPVLDIDDSGTGALAASINLRSLPSMTEYPANLDSPEYLVFDPAIEKYAKKTYRKKLKSILVSFGGSDPANLSDVMIRISKLADPSYEWTLVRGRFNTNNWVQGRYTELAEQQDIFGAMEQADLFITSSGIAAYEAVAIGTPVLLLNPTAYHDAVAERGGLFESLGVYERGEEEDNTPFIAARFRDYVHGFDRLNEAAQEKKTRVDTNGAARVCGLIESMVKWGRESACPVCDARKDTALFRDAERTLFACESCGLFRMQYYNQKKFVYEKKYFIEEYREQYGKTYDEDRENIDRLNKARLDIMEKYFVKIEAQRQFKGRELLDIGCAYGYFLDSSRYKGWNPAGIEASKHAADFARNTLALDVRQGSILDMEIPSNSYNAITMWYAIEHIPDLQQLMEKVYLGLQSGGILALSTPNSTGYTGRYNRAKYIAEHPEDHWYDFNVGCMKLMLKKFNFKILEVRITGIHFERFLENRKSKFWDAPVFRWLYERFARWMKLGDTFEIYAQKR